MELNVNKELVDAIAEKFGMFIDWTADNVVPQVMDILMRYRTYEIINHSMFVIIGLILVIISVIIGNKIIKEFDVTPDDFPKEAKPYQTFHGKYVSHYFNSSGDLAIDDVKIRCFVEGFLILSAFIAGLIFFGDSFPCLMKWIFVPEIQFYSLIMGA